MSGNSAPPCERPGLLPAMAARGAPERQPEAIRNVP